MVLDLLDAELQAVVSCLLGCRELNSGPCKSSENS